MDRAAEESPVINEELLIARNRNWLPKLRQRLLEPGTTFVAVGAGHLVGPDGLVAMLQAEGVKVEQIAP
ncbi:TraB/GumN family protein [Hankyongella ginsenosidimutans]|uniref:TraB/GumN family protein n=1 Tax=Hankyongella ginsenosidimutans TaxID=1763828 RepID=UPI001CA31CA4|nr:TraB/GumN family protein [Hankyongella ginsenosidimutans]